MSVFKGLQEMTRQLEYARREYLQKLQGGEGKLHLVQGPVLLYLFLAAGFCCVTFPILKVYTDQYGSKVNVFSLRQHLKIFYLISQFYSMIGCG